MHIRKASNDVPFVANEFAQHQKSLNMLVWIFCSFSEELDVMMTLKEIDDIRSNVKISMPEGQVDDWRLHWCRH